jgi:hypothetical protein
MPASVLLVAALTHVLVVQLAWSRPFSVTWTKQRIEGFARRSAIAFADDAAVRDDERADVAVLLRMMPSTSKKLGPREGLAARQRHVVEVDLGQRA